MKKKHSDISLKLSGECIPVHIFLNDIENFFQCVKEVTKDVTGDRGDKAWFIGVHKGSACADFYRNENCITKEQAKRIAENINSGILREKNTKGVVYQFSPKALESLKKLNLSNNTDDTNTVKVSIKVAKSYVEINENAINVINAENIQQGFKEYGTISGQLRDLHRGRGVTGTLKEEIWGRSINCNIPENLKEIARNAWDLRVELTGEIEYNGEGLPEHIDIEAIKVFPQDFELPDLSEIRGILAHRNG